MTPDDPKPDEPTEQRADDQETAIEEAFSAGTLPEDDRREEGSKVSEEVERHASPDLAAQTIANTDTPSEEPVSVAPSCMIDKDADGLWQVTSTYKDGRVTVSHWPDIRHAVHNTAAWTAANL